MHQSGESPQCANWRVQIVSRTKNYTLYNQTLVKTIAAYDVCLITLLQKQTQLCCVFGRGQTHVGIVVPFNIMDAAERKKLASKNSKHTHILPNHYVL